MRRSGRLTQPGRAPHTIRWLVWLTLHAFIFFFNGASLAQPSEMRFLIDRELEIHRVVLDRIQEDRVVFEEDGLRRNMPLMRVLAIVSPKDGLAPMDQPVLELIDGQRWVGRPGRSTGDGESITWSNDYLGTITVALDRVRRVRLTSGTPMPQLTPATTGDIVRLVNGDVLSGYVSSLSDPLTIETTAGETTIPLERGGAVALLNPVEPARGTRVWTEDGSIVEIESLRIEESALVIRMPGRERESMAGREYLRAVVFDASALSSVGSLDPVVESVDLSLSPPDPPRALHPEAPLRLTDLELHGPVQVSYPLPKGASLFATRLTLPRYARGWADFDVVILIDGAESGRWRLNENATEWSVRIELPQDADSLTLRIEPGLRGPVLDVVRLEQPRLRIGPE